MANSTNADVLGGEDRLSTPAEVAEFLKLDVTTVRRLFLDRSDVVKIGRTSARGARRSYVTLRIPVSALQRFLKEHR
jgi:hypothetical protein